jgi:pyruvate formate lyase activating enzyme
VVTFVKCKRYSIGCEVTINPELVIDLLKKCRQAGIHTAIDTCGDVKWEVLEKIVRY